MKYKLTDKIKEILDHYGNARVCDNAKVCGDASVCDNAKVYGNALVYFDVTHRSKRGERNFGYEAETPKGECV